MEKQKLRFVLPLKLRKKEAGSIPCTNHHSGTAGIQQFSQRMQDFPVRVDLLCRFRSASEQKEHRRSEEGTGGYRYWNASHSFKRCCI